MASKNAEEIRLWFLNDYGLYTMAKRAVSALNKKEATEYLMQDLKGRPLPMGFLSPTPQCGTL